ncbi:RNA polymerase subunit sigma-70, partial [bacterium (Candidatus Gribaldobacteria) CG08_land_8_20_14_0_20_39_15]
MANLRKKFSKIYDQYINKIYRFIFLKVNSQEIAQDLTSETFLRGWESFKEKNEEIENIQAFLYRIARNLVTDH